MNSKFLWHNFASADREGAAIRGLGHLVHEGMLAQQEEEGRAAKKAQKSKPAAQTVKGENREHTTGEIEKSKENLSGSKEHKKCSAGKACNATCIYKGDDCISTLNPSLQEQIPRFLSYVKSYVSRGGSEELALAALSRIDAESHEKIKKISSALDEIARKYPNPQEREERINQTMELVLPGMAKKGDMGERQAHDEDHINFIRNNKQIDKLEKVYADIKNGKLKTPEEINAALRPIAMERRVNDISDEQVNLAMAMLPKDLVNTLRTQGQPGEWGKWGANQSTLNVPDGGHTSKNESGLERARLIVRIGMEENMRDMYDGRRIGFGDIDLEHGIPYTVGGRGAETGSNFGPATRLNNRSKGDMSPEEWRRTVLRDYPTDEKGSLTAEARRLLLKRQEEVREYNAKRENIKGEQTRPETVYSLFRGVDESNAKNPEKQAHKNKIMASLAGYTETYFVGTRPNRGNSVRKYLYRESNLGSSVLDLAASKIDKLAKEGRTEEINKIISILQSGPNRVNQVLETEFGKDRSSVAAAELGSDTANKIRQQLIDEITAIQ